MKKRRNFKHLTAADRDRIHALYGHGHTQVQIAKVLGVTKGTISRELGRYNKTTWRYSAARAQKDAEEKRSHSKCPGMKVESSTSLKRHIIKELKRLRSPDEIAGRMKQEKRRIRGGLLVVVPRAHLLAGSIIPNKTTKVIVPAMQRISTTLPLDTCTFDNGIENIHHKEFGVDAYFCDKGAPWQKPHVESSIGLIRRWFIPKGTNLATVSNDTYQSQLHLLNHKYRKSLGYQSAYEVALAAGIIATVPQIPLSLAVASR